MSTSFQPSLFACILMDFIGMASYFFPGLGEGFDVLWAPISGLVFYYWFKSPIWALGAAAEELIPFTDIIPAFTLGYFILGKKDSAEGQ